MLRYFIKTLNNAINVMCLTLKVLPGQFAASGCIALPCGNAMSLIICDLKSAQAPNVIIR